MALEVVGLREILRPLDEVHIHGEVTLTLQQYDEIMAEAVKGTGRSKESRRLFHFLSSRPVQQGVNTVHLDLIRHALRRRASASHRTLDVSFSQEWFPDTRHEGVPSKAQSAKHGPRIEAILEMLSTHRSPTNLMCHVDWMFQEDEADPVIPIPFPLTVGSELGMPNVRGLRIANDDATQVASLDRMPSGNLSVNITVRLPDATIGADIVEQVIQEGNSILKGLIRIKPQE